MNAHPIYVQTSGSGPRCSTPRSARLRERRFAMGYEERAMPPEIEALSEETTRVFLAREAENSALARAEALLHVARYSPIALERDTGLLGGEDPFFFNLMYPALRADRYGSLASHSHRGPVSRQRLLRTLLRRPHHAGS